MAVSRSLQVVQHTNWASSSRWWLLSQYQSPYSSAFRLLFPGGTRAAVVLALLRDAALAAQLVPLAVFLRWVLSHVSHFCLSFTHCPSRLCPFLSINPAPNPRRLVKSMKLFDFMPFGLLFRQIWL